MGRKLGGVQRKPAPASRGTYWAKSWFVLPRQPWREHSGGVQKKALTTVVQRSRRTVKHRVMLDQVFAGRSGSRGALRAAALVPILLGIIGCSSDGADAPAGAVSEAPAALRGSNPVAGQQLFVDPASPAAAQAKRWRDGGRGTDAAAMALLAKRATAEWMVEASGVEQRVRAEAQRAAEAGRTALLVAYHVPGRDCGNYSAGGSDTPTAYRAWARSFAHGIGSRRAIVIVEPDAIPQAIVQSCLSQAARPSATP